MKLVFVCLLGFMMMKTSLAATRLCGVEVNETVKRTELSLSENARMLAALGAEVFVCANAEYPNRSPVLVYTFLRTDGSPYTYQVRYFGFEGISSNIEIRIQN